MEAGNGMTVDMGTSFSNQTNGLRRFRQAYISPCRAAGLKCEVSPRVRVDCHNPPELSHFVAAFRRQSAVNFAGKTWTNYRTGI
jgi:hypothetical protein